MADQDGINPSEMKVLSGAEVETRSSQSRTKPKKKEKVSVDPVQVEEVQLIPKNERLTQVEVTKLPSEGKSYPTGWRIIYQPYTFGEIKNASSSKMENVGVFLEPLKKITCNFNEKDITLADYLYLALAIKMSSLGTTVGTVNILCVNEECNNLITHQITNQSIEFDDMSEVKAFPINIQTSFGNFKAMPLTVGMFEEIMKSDKDISDPTVLASYQMTHVPDEEDDTPMTSEEIQDKLSLLTLEENEKDIMIIEKVFEDLLFHGMKPITDVVCDACGVDNAIFLEGEDGMLIQPFRESAPVSIEDAISFGD